MVYCIGIEYRDKYILYTYTYTPVPVVTVPIPIPFVYLYLWLSAPITMPLSLCLCLPGDTGSSIPQWSRRRPRGPQVYTV